MSVNKVILIGNLGKDPEIRSIDANRRVANFSLATSETYKNQQGEKVTQTEWHNIVFYGAIVDTIEKYLKKGTQIFVEGKIRSRSYDDKEGIKRYITEIIGDTFRFTGSAPKSGENGNGQQNGAYEQPVMSDNNAADDLPF
jgi:single-strand DNA-binding protein